jgi:hypothetical protein
VAELGAEYEIVARVKDYRRKITVGVVHRSHDLAVWIHLKRGSYTLRTELTPVEIARIRVHLTSNATQDLVL